MVGRGKYCLGAKVKRRGGGEEYRKLEEMGSLVIVGKVVWTGERGGRRSEVSQCGGLMEQRGWKTKRM